MTDDSNENSDGLWGVCTECGAVVANPTVHADWHASLIGAGSETH